MVKELKSIKDFDSAIKEAGNKMLCVMFHNGNENEELDYGTMKETYGK